MTDDASRWSLEHLAAASGRAAGDDTLAIRQRLAATPPAITAGGEPSAAIPRGAPAIPGVVDLEAVGRGGMSVVYRGRDTTLDRLVAVKVLRAWMPLSESARQRAEREALMLARLDHPNVVRIHAAGEVGGTPYLVMEWVAGPTLQQRIDERPLPPRDAGRIALDLARALAQVHALGIVHRDIKPDNILVEPAADGPGTPKLADFGLARPEEAAEHLTQADTVLGTPAYMAPEQTGLAAALAEVGPPADIHALGGVIFAMLTGHAPYEAASALESMQRSIRGEVAHAGLADHAPVDLRTILWKCLEPEPARRYRSAGELADDLARFLDGRPVLARPVSPVERLGKWARRQPVMAAAAGLVAVFVAGAIGGTIYHVLQLRQANDEIARRRDEAEEAAAVAERTLARLTDASIQRMLMRGGPLDEGDRDYLRQVRDEYLTWPLGGDPVRGLQIRLDGLVRLFALFEGTNQVVECLETARAEVAVIDELATCGLTDLDVNALRVPALLRVRKALVALARYSEAADVTRDLIAIIENVPPDTSASRLQTLASLKCDLGGYLQRLSRNEESVAVLAESLAEMRRLREATPEDATIVTMELGALFNAAQIAFRSKRQAERREHLELVVSLTEAALPRLPEHRAELAEKQSLALANLVNMECESGRWDDALPLAERRLSLCRETMAEFPEEKEPVRQTIDAVLLVFKVHRGLKRLPDSRPLLDMALPLAEQLYAGESAEFSHSFLLARVLHSQAELEKAAGNWERSMAALEREFALLEPWRNHASQAKNVAELWKRARIMADWVQKKLAAPATADGAAGGN
jgi:tetratricopeptide (TPR) repeat protein